MKQAFKTITIAITGIVLAFGLTLTSCKKVEKGPAGPTGATGASGPEAKTYTVDVMYYAGDTYKTFSGVTDFEEGDILLFFVQIGSGFGGDGYIQMPLSLNGIDYFGLFYEISGTALMFNYISGTASSPWTSSQAMRYKIVHIKSTGLIKHPNVDLSNYKEVKTAYNL